MKERAGYLDCLKCIAVFAVCYYHFNGYLGYDPYSGGIYIGGISYFSMVACGIGVPLFFMVHGALLLNRDFCFQRHIRKCVHILIQFMVWRSVWFAFHIVLKKINRVEPVDFARYLAGGGYDGIWTGFFWFIFALMQIYILFPIIKRTFDNDKRELLFLISAVFAFTFLKNDLITCMKLVSLAGGFNSVHFNIPELLSNYYMPLHPSFGYAVCYFVLGGVLHKNIYIEGKRPECISIAAGILLPSGLILLYLKSVIETSFDRNLFTGYSAYDSGIMLLIASSLFVLFAVKRVTLSNRWIRYLAENTIGIYYLHAFLGNLFIAVFPIQRWNKGLLGIGINSIKAFCLIFGSLSVIYLLKKVRWIGKMI